MLGAGKQIGPYTLIRKLGRGGFGEVWLAERASKFFNKKVAVKLPHDTAQIDFETVKREAIIWEQASGHPNVLPIIDADEYAGQVVIVSEYADGGSLADRLQRDGKLSVEKAIEMTMGVLSGLEYLHSKQIIHRDIKPQNILLQGEMPRLADFGISRAMNASTISSVVVGTDAFMSPEAFDGKRSVQTDIWSVGAVLYLLLKGDLPFPQTHPSERMFAIFSKNFEPLPDENPSKLKEIVRKALAKNPQDRYQSASQMREDLQKALASLAFPQFAPTEILPKSFISDAVSSAPTIENNQSVITEIPQKLPLSRANQIAPTQPAIEKPLLVRDVSQNAHTAGNIPALNSKPIPHSSPARAYKFGDVFALATGGIVIGFLLLILIAFYLSNSRGRMTNSNNQTVYSNTNKTTAVSNTTTAGNSSNSVSPGEKYMKEGQDYLDQEQYDPAIAAFANVIELDPSNSSAYFYRGFAYDAKKQYDKAISDFTKAIELNPNHSDAFYCRGKSYENRKHYDKAIADYTKFIEINPILQTKGYFQRGYIYQEKGQKDKAIADYTKVIEIDPSDSVAYYNRGNAYSDKRQHDKAIADYDKTIELDPTNSDAYNNRGNSYFNKGDYKQAGADFRKALELNPNDKTARDNLKIVGEKP